MTWDQSLVPDHVDPPSDYIASKASEKPEPVSLEDVMDFFVKFIEVDQLGRLANAHVAISDESPLGIRDPRCIELAKAFSAAGR